MDKALESVEQMGYGVVVPNEEEIMFATPEVEANGNRKNIKMTANCSCLHIMMKFFPKLNEFWELLNILFNIVF